MSGQYLSSVPVAQTTLSDAVSEGSKGGRRTSSHENRMSICEWVKRTISDRISLLDVVLRLSSGEPRISIPYVGAQTGVNVSSILSYKGLISDVLGAMCDQGIVIPGYSSRECDWRRKLLRWYEVMTESEKKDIPIFGNKIKHRGYLDRVESLSGLNDVRSLPLVAMTLDEIVNDLREFGFISNEYKSVKQRIDERRAVIVLPQESGLQRIAKYRNITMTCVDDLGKGDGEPFAPLLHLFACASLGSHSESGISNYLEGYKSFRDDLINSGFEGHEPIGEMIGIYSLVRFRKHLESLMIEDKCSSHTCNTLLSSARQMMMLSRELVELGTHSFIAASGFDVSSETDLYDPYSPTERSRISSAITEAIIHTNELAKAYVLSGVGEDPLAPSGDMKRGYGTLENARWIFEHKLGCDPIGFKTADKNDPYQKAFIRILAAQKKPIKEIYESWGVLYARDSHMLTPYVARLAQVTGLNADSLLSLDLEDFEERHKLTNRSCLRYWKERSTGAKEYHLDLFFAEISWLTTSQSREVKKIFDDVIALTAGFRHQADPEEAKRLFIYRSSSPRFYNVVKSLEESASTITNKMFDQFSRQHGLLADNGEVLRLSASRFRPSFVSELVERGVSLREVQVILGHKSMRTTIGYLERLDLNRAARGILDEALKKIHAGTIAHEPSNAAANSNSLVDSQIIFKTPFGGCRNILNPPDFIKKLKSYIPGRPCALYNRCLSCDNRLITKANLPDLYAMRRDYLNMLEATRVIDTPYGSIVLENLALLENLLDPNMSDYSIAELEEAERLSEYIETSVIVEGVVM